MSNYLFTKTKPAKQKAHAKNEQQIGEYRTQKGSLDNLDFILREKNLLVFIAGRGQSEGLTLVRAMLQAKT